LSGPRNTIAYPRQFCLCGSSTLQGLNFLNLKGWEIHYEIIREGLTVYPEIWQALIDERPLPETGLVISGEEELSVGYRLIWKIEPN
jgi:hypothetical protein